MTAANVLVVEGLDDLHSVVGLMRRHIPWPEERAQAPVEIVDALGHGAQGGLIVENDVPPRLGVWIMPDKVSCGDLETFLRHLVPDRSEPVWAHAVESTTRAHERGAEYRDAHRNWFRALYQL